MIAKVILKPRHKEETSYIMKNIVLWLAENNPQSMFNERSLFYWIRESLLELRTALSKKHLQYYMIPDRNLMAANGLTDEQGRLWIATITDMIHEGPNMILRLPMIRQAIISHPEPLLWYNRTRIELEIIVLEVIKSVPPTGCFFTYILHHLDRHGLLNRWAEILADIDEKISYEERPDMNYQAQIENVMCRLLK
ncbi:hypothetical protein DPMN_032263 [Dreissena polymorpha]|uniref:Mab-21-like HhH/H2TH-like domain-containing protein n=1 Tax=Dreissena polymorpha TaxID=45954 RepID=A0A9D4M3M2_DREPO|nr:hypothetical protein DPMN_032263 [Dreissena polymorpha]